MICQGQLDAVVPLENASMPGRVVVQWDKDDCADMGIVKVDLLGLGMMAVLQDALALVNGETASNAESADTQDDELRDDVPADSASSAYSSYSSIWRICRERPGGLQDALRGRHDRRLPGRVARADGDAAAAEAGDVLRPRRAGGDHPARADRRPDGASVSESPRRARAGARTRIRRSSRSWRGRSACRCSRSSCCGWRWSPPASPAGRPKSCAARWASSDPRSG